MKILYCYAKFYFFLYLFPHVCGGGGDSCGGGGGVGVLITQYFIQSPKLDILYHY